MLFAGNRQIPYVKTIATIEQIDKAEHAWAVDRAGTRKSLPVALTILWDRCGGLEGYHYMISIVSDSLIKAYFVSFGVDGREQVRVISNLLFSPSKITQVSVSYWANQFNSH